MKSTKIKKNKQSRKIYDQNYYKAQAMIRDQWFLEKIDWLKKRFAEVGCPLPRKPFKKYKQYKTWNEHFWNRFAEMERSDEYIQNKLRITGGKKRISSEEYDALDEFREKFLPPVYGQTYNEILNHFGIDYNDRGFRDFLELYIFFGRREYRTPHFYVAWKRKEKTEQMELFVQILGHTKKEDIMENWGQIAEEQKRLKDYIGKSKEWKTFDRDIMVYNLYKELKKKLTPNRELGLSGFTATDINILAKMRKKWPKLTTNGIRTIITRTKKRLGEI